MEINVEGLKGKSWVDGDKLVISFSGTIDHYSTTAAQKFMTDCSVQDKNKKNVVIDMEHIGYMSSTGIGAMVGLLKELKPRGQMLYLYRMSPKVYDVFQLLGFTSFFTIIYDYDEIPASLELRKPSFPLIAACPTCRKKYRIKSSGRYRCSKCKTILILDESGNLQPV